MMAYDPVKVQGELGLRGRDVIVLGAGAHIVLCAVDSTGLASAKRTTACSAKD